MRLLAISDLHLNHEVNREALKALPEYPDDWLILGGDLGERTVHLEFCLREVKQRFAKVFWVPGNHELWTVKGKDKGDALPGEYKYKLLVELCRHHGVHTPEDPFVEWPGEGPKTVIAPCFVLYDYSFSPDGFTPEMAVKWARESGIRARDEDVLLPDPYPSRQAWCAQRVAYTEARLGEVPEGTRIVLINHWPLRHDLVRLFRVPRFAPWCGTRKTEDWHTRFDVAVSVHGHLHVRATDWRDGVRFEEVALGYPRHWTPDKGMAHYLRDPAGTTCARWRVRRATMASLILIAVLASLPAFGQEDEDLYFDPTERPQGHARVSETIARPQRGGTPQWPNGADRSVGIVRCDVQVYVGRQGETRAVRIERCPAAFREAARMHAASWKHQPVRLGGGIKPVWYPTEVVFNGAAQALRPEPIPRPRDLALKVQPGEVVLHHEEVKVENRVMPEFPKSAISSGIIEVHCAVRVHVDAEGDVSDVGFERCPDDFHDPVLGAIALWSHGEVSIAGKATPFTYQSTLKLRHEPDSE